jgi:hypothetical protein
MSELMQHYTSGQVAFFLILKLGLLCFAIYGVWQLRKATRG